ncbi:MAG: hypothetical protein FWD55_03685 [Propionibacteriaceae bacterium]|nr:hypothetical protein [Propionibacteriaceae bacterium]
MSQNAYDDYRALTQKKKPVGVWVGSGVGVLVLGLAIYLVASHFPTSMDPAAPPITPTQQPTQTHSVPPEPTEVCPKYTPGNERADHPEGDGWVYGGALAYQRLSEPWSAVRTTEGRIPFGRDVADQYIVIHENTSGASGWSRWVAQFLVGELYAGDGFYEPEDASKIVNKCIFGAFYGGAAVTGETLRSEPYTLDGRDGWFTETMLSYELEGLETTSELAIVIIVATSSLSSSILYVSLPTDAMHLKPGIDAAISSLRLVK